MREGGPAGPHGGVSPLFSQEQRGLQKLQAPVLAPEGGSLTWWTKVSPLEMDLLGRPVAGSPCDLSKITSPPRDSISSSVQ